MLHAWSSSCHDPARGGSSWLVVLHIFFLRRRVVDFCLARLHLSHNKKLPIHVDNTHNATHSSHFFGCSILWLISPFTYILQNIAQFIKLTYLFILFFQSLYFFKLLLLLLLFMFAFPDFIIIKKFLSIDNIMNIIGNRISPSMILAQK